MALPGDIEDVGVDGLLKPDCLGPVLMFAKGSDGGALIAVDRRLDFPGEVMGGAGASGDRFNFPLGIRLENPTAGPGRDLSTGERGPLVCK
jgi:hypothetical protein